MLYSFIYPELRNNPEYKFEDVLSGYNYNFSLLEEYNEPTGLTLNGNLIVSGDTFLNALTASTINAGDIIITGNSIFNTAIFNALTADTITSDFISGSSISINGGEIMTRIANTQDFRLYENNSSTGVIYYEGISANTIDNSKFDVGAVKGWIVDNTTDPENPIYQYIDFSGSTAANPSGLTLSYLATNPVTYLGVSGNTTADIIQSTSPFNNNQHRSVLELGVIVHSNNVAINATNNNPNIVIDPVPQFYDLIHSLGPFNVDVSGVSGNIFNYNGANLQVDKTSGSIFSHGSNYINDPKSPHVIELSSGSSITFRYRLQDSTEFSDTTEVNPNIYDNGGVTAATPSNKYTVQRIYLFTSNISRWQYGQNVYDSLDDAEASLSTEPFNIEENLRDNGLLRGFLIVKEGTTDLSDSKKSRFIEANHFGHANDTVVGNVHRTEILNHASSGLREGGALSVNALDPTQYDIAAGSGIVMDNTTNPNNPTLTEIEWNDITGNTVSFSGGNVATYVFINESGGVFTLPSSTPPVGADRRSNILLGLIGHSSSVITKVFNFPSRIVSPVSQLDDLSYSVGPFSVQGNLISGIAGTTQLYKTSGRSYFNGANFQSDSTNPSVFNTDYLSASTLVYAKQDELIGLSATTIDPDYWDDGGTITPLGNNKFSAHRIWYQPDGNLLIFQFGQASYNSESEAKLNFVAEDYIIPSPLDVIAYLVSVIIVEKGETDLSNSVFIKQGKFAGTGGGGSGAVDTLQTAYNNSIQPEILTDPTRTSVDIRIGSGSDGDNAITIQDNSGTINAFITGEGNASFNNLSGSTLFSGATDLYDIFSTSAGVTGSGTINYLPMWDSSTSLTDSIMSYDGSSGITVGGNVYITGNVEVLGTATTINTQDLAVKDNNILLNSGGTHTSALYGGIAIEDGVSNGVDSNWIIDSSGNWSANTSIISQGLNVESGTMLSGGTDLYSIFALSGSNTDDITRVQGGTNISTGGTVNEPIVNLDDNIILSSVSATTLTADTITTGGITNSGIYTSNSTSTRDKIRLWNNNTYTMGMQGSVTFGGLGDFSLTYQVANDFDKGFWWGDTSHSIAQGAMALTSEGKLTVANSLRLGYGEFDTTAPGVTYVLDVSGATNIDGIIYSAGTPLESIFALAGTDTNSYVTGYTYDNSNKFTINLNNGSSYEAIINEMTGLTVNGSVSATTYYSGSTDISDLFKDWTLQSDFNSHTGDTNNPHSVTASQVGAYSTTETDNLLNTKADLSGATFTGNIYAPVITGDTIYSGGTPLENIFSPANLTLSQVLTNGSETDTSVINVTNGTYILWKYTGSTGHRIIVGATAANNTTTLPAKSGILAHLDDITADTNYYATGFTYDNANAFTVSVNDGNDYTAVIDVMTGLTVSGNLSATTIYSGGTDLYNIFSTTNTHIGNLDLIITDATRNLNLQGNTSASSLLINNLTGGTALSIQGNGTVFSNGIGLISSNTMFGEEAGNGNGSLATRSFFGYRAGYNSTQDNMTAVGWMAGAVSTAAGITAIGRDAGSNSSASNSAFVGMFAGYYSTGINSVGFGYDSARENSGTLVSALGYRSAYKNSGSFITAFGNYAGANNTGDLNSYFGDSAGYQISGGTAINTGATNSLFMGAQTYALGVDQTNQIVIGHNAIGNGSHTVTLGNTLINGTYLEGVIYSGGTPLESIFATAGADTNNYVTGFTYDGSNNFTVSVNDGNSYIAGIDTMSGLTIDGDLTVNGDSIFSGTGTDVVTIYGSGDTSPVFSVQGSAGELFAVTDSLSGTLFSVNDISGLPILEVVDDSTVLMGNYLAPSLNTTKKVTANSGTTVAYTMPSSGYTSAFYEYSIYGATGARAGSMMAIWSGASVQYNEAVTNDIGDTSDVTMFVDTTSSIASLKVSANTNSWTVKTIVRSI